MYRRIFKVAVLSAAGMVLLLLAGGAADKAQSESASEPKPEIVTMPAQKMAVVYTKGDPNTVAGPAVSALYGTVYALSGDLKSKGVDFTIGALRARWPDANTTPKEQWTGIWGLSVPDKVDSITSVVPGTDVKLETWQYGTVAQILHLGPYDTEPATIQRLMDFISRSGYEIAGSHEEEYLTPPGAPEQKTIIRYPIKKK